MDSLTERIDHWLLYRTSVPLTQKVFFTENLKVMVHAGLSVSEALGTLALQVESKTFKRIIGAVGSTGDGVDADEALAVANKVEQALLQRVPEAYLLHAHHWLILHGRYTCLARKPRCEVCLINDLCRWPEKTV